MFDWTLFHTAMAEFHRQMAMITSNLLKLDALLH